ncbi:hypothetical protein [Gordonia shandongensis]|uniref:hypothetical protein n=1 Tax=Gordonia shandongensis TaxID=376351 RepID=UPI0012EB779C|nr:hypothetical protein [Gordonia shandongensis]
MLQNGKNAWLGIPRVARVFMVGALVVVITQAITLTLAVFGLVVPGLQQIGFGAFLVMGALAFLIANRGSCYLAIRALPTLLMVAGTPVGLWWAFQAPGRHLTWAIIPFYSILAIAAVWSVLTLQAFGTWKQAVKARTTNGIFWVAQIATTVGVALWPAAGNADMPSPTADREQLSVDIGTQHMATGMIALGTFGLVFFIAGAVRDAAEVWASHEEGSFQRWFTSAGVQQSIRRLADRHRSPLGDNKITLLACVVLVEWWFVIVYECLIGNNVGDRIFRAGLVLAGVPTLALIAAWCGVRQSGRIAARYPVRRRTRTLIARARGESKRRRR